MTASLRAGLAPGAFYPDGPHWVYRHINATGGTLYIGCTSQPEGRQPAHRRESSWFPLVAEIVYHGPLSMRDAYQLERELVAAEEPPFNIQGTRRGRGRLPSSRVVAVEDWQATS